jgi:uncharacterized protein (TIGR02271 family)
MPTTTSTVVGVFSDYGTAQRVREKLLNSGFAADDVHISSGDTFTSEVASGGTRLTGDTPSDMSGGGIGGFFRRLFGTDVDEQESRRFSEAIRRGGTVVSVRASQSDADRAADIMDEYGPVDIDRDIERDASSKGERSVPVVREELQVGKRAVRRGGVRVFSRVVEEPAEETVTLREERVRVDRVPADRPATEADIRAQEQVIEVTEMAEEPVVGKRSRVVEEVVVGKESREHTETVRDTLRRTDVNVEKTRAGERSYAGDYDDDFRQDYETRYGATRGATYETYAPAYQYGYRMASDERYRGKSWDQVESTLRTDYEREYPNSTWEQMKAAVRHGWDKVTGRR